MKGRHLLLHTFFLFVVPFRSSNAPFRYVVHHRFRGLRVTGSKRGDSIAAGIMMQLRKSFPSKVNDTLSAYAAPSRHTHVWASLAATLVVLPDTSLLLWLVDACSTPPLVGH